MRPAFHLFLTALVMAFMGLTLSACGQASSDPDAWKQRYAHLKPDKPTYPGAFVLEGTIDQDMLDRLDAFKGSEAVYRSALPLEAGYLPYDFKITSQFIEKLSKLDRVIIDDYCTAFCAPYLFTALDNVYVYKNAVIGFTKFQSVDAQYLIGSGQITEDDFAKYILPVAEAERAYLEKWVVDVDFLLSVNSVSKYRCMIGPIYRDLGKDQKRYGATVARKNYSYWATDSKNLVLLNPNAVIAEGYDDIPIQEKLRVHRRSNIPYYYTEELVVEDFMDEAVKLPLCE